MSSAIANIIVKQSQNLIRQSVPKIIDIAQKAAIENIGQLNEKMPDTCLIQDELQKLLKIRNQLVNKLNTTAQTINKLSQPLNVLTTAVNVTNTALNIASTTRKAANTSLLFIPPIVPIPGQVVSTINSLKDLEDFLDPKITTLTNNITSITTAISFASSILLKLVDLFKSIDSYLINCLGENIISNDSTSSNNSNILISLNDDVKTLITTQNAANQTDNNTYKGFLLEIVEEQYSSTVKRRKAVAKNRNDIILLSTPLTFSTDNQTLINEIKLLIDTNNLKAD